MVRRILVISLAGIGDTLMATPVLAALRRGYPSAEIDVAVMWPGSAQLLRGNPAVDRVHQCNLIQEGKGRSLLFLLGLRRRGYDLSITCHPQGRRVYRWVTRVIGARRRLSHRYENQMWLDRWLVTDSVEQDYGVGCAENNLRLLEMAGCPVEAGPLNYGLFLEPAEVEWAQNWEREVGLAGTRWVGIHVGSGGTKNLALRRWPLALWMEWVLGLREALPDVGVVAFGGPEEREAHERMQKRLPAGSVLFPPTPDLRHAAALVGRASAFVSVDTAFMHLAAARAVPHQCVIQTPTLNPPVYPMRPDWTWIPNPAVGERALDFYRYDGRPMAGTNAELERIMESVRPRTVLEAVLAGI
jgi:ADP-heptose:LPS heptosyltransferase